MLKKKILLEILENVLKNKKFKKIKEMSYFIRYNQNTKITGNIPLNILNGDDEKNTIEFEPDGFYKLGYGINKIYYNDKKNYKFHLNNYNGIGDVIMYGDFDRTVIDVKINNHQITLVRNEIESILDLLRIGTNEIKILTDKVEIEELIIENDRYNFYD